VKLVGSVIIITSGVVVSVCAFRKEGRKKKAANMLNSLDTAQECDARDDRFCTGAGFIIYKMRRLLRLALGETRNKNTFPLAFKFLLAKFVTLDFDFKPLRHKVTKQHKAVLVRLCVLVSLWLLLKF